MGAQGIHLVHGAAGKHSFKASGNAGAEYVAVGGEHGAFDGPAIEEAGLRRVLKGGQRFACGAFDGQSADDPLGVGDFEAAGGFGVFSFEERHTAGFVEAFYFLLNLQDDGLRNFGNVGESFCQRIEIKPCAANENGFAVGVDFTKNSRDGSEKLAGRKALTCGHRAVEAMLGLRLVLD